MFIGQADGPAAVGSAPRRLKESSRKPPGLDVGKLLAQVVIPPAGSLPVEFSPGI